MKRKRSTELIEGEAIADEVVGCRELVVEAAGRRISFAGVPVETRPVMFLRQREQVLDQRPSNAMASCFWRYKQIFEIADRVKRPGAFVNDGDAEASDLFFHLRDAPEQG